MNYFLHDDNEVGVIMIDRVVEPILGSIYAISDEYGVNPLIFGFLYFVTVPTFWVSLIYLGRNLRQQRPLLIPVTGIVASQLLCYIYLFSVGKNLPLWVYVLVTGLILYGAWKTWKSVRNRMEFELEK